MNLTLNVLNKSIHFLDEANQLTAIFTQIAKTSRNGNNNS